MVKEEHVFIKSYLTFRGRSKTTRNKLYYVVFGQYSSSFQSGRYFVYMFQKSDERSLHESMTFRKNEFCGLEVGSTKKTVRWKLWEKGRHQTFLRVFFTARDTVEFFIDNEDTNPLQAFRTIEAWRRKLTKELGYRCYWNVYMRQCGQEWGEGYGKLHLTEKSLAIVSTEKRPQTLGHWYLKSAIQCKYVGTKRLIIRFEDLDEPLVFETEDAQEIARTLAMNMTGLADKPVYDPFPKQDERPISKTRKSVSNRHKPVVTYSSDEEDADGQHAADNASESGKVTPNTPVPLSPSVGRSPPRTNSDLVSPKQLAKCERKFGERGEKRNSPAPSSPSIHNDEYPPAYDVAARADIPAYSESPQSRIPDRGENGEIDRYRLKVTEPNGIHVSSPRLHPKLEKLLIPPHPEPPAGPEPSSKPVPSPRSRVPPERPPKSPMLRRPPQHSPHHTSVLQLLDNFVCNGINSHPQQPATPPPRPVHQRPEELQTTLPRQTDKRSVEQTYLTTLPLQKKPVAAPRQPRVALSRLKSKSMEVLATSIGWDEEFEVNQDRMGGGGLVPIIRDRNSRKTIKKKQPTWTRPLSSYSDDDVNQDDKEEIYDVSNILNHLSNRRDDRSFRLSTMWYVNILSAYDKPPPLSSYDPDTPPISYNSDAPPPLPPRDPDTQPIPRQVPMPTDEYWSAMIICHTLRRALVKDPPLPDTLKLSVSLRNKVCMMLYISLLNGKDWRDFADLIGLEYQAVELIEAFTAHHSNETAGEIVLRHWQFCYNKYPYDREKCPRACERAELLNILREMHRTDIIKVINDNRT